MQASCRLIAWDGDGAECGAYEVSGPYDHSLEPVLLQHGAVRGARDGIAPVRCLQPCGPSGVRRGWIGL